MLWTGILAGALAFLAFTYAGYPLWALAMARLRERRWRVPEDGSPLPTVTCIVATHDEGEKLVEKVRALLALDYPSGGLDVVIADDASSDGSPKQARALDPTRVRIARSPEFRGKPAALVRAARVAQGEILLMCDVRQRFDPHVAETLVRPFADPRVGAATGALVMDGARGTGAYWRYETAIRRAEGRFSSVVGVTGAIYAIRRSCFPLDLPERTLLDDLYIPMRVVLGGRRVVFIEEAKAYDVEYAMKQEFRRKVRTLAGNHQIPLLLPALVNPFRNPLFFQFCGHKLARLLCPWALLAAFIAALLGSGWWAEMLLGLQVLAYGLAALGGIRGRAAGRIATLCYTFVALNAAALVGLVRLIRGQARVTWAPPRAQRSR